MHPTPYHEALLGLGETLADWTPDDVLNRPRPKLYSHWHARNEWVYAEMANVLLGGAYAWAYGDGDADTQTRRLGFCAAFLDALVDAAVEDRWFHRGQGMGDPNIDRFTLLPTLEAYLLVADALTPPLRERFLTKLNGILNVQYNEYGGGSREDVPPEPYPNMDVYYCLIMLHGYHITGDERWKSEFEDYLQLLEDAQFEDGGWTYIKGTNECPVYHDINVTLMARIHDLSGAPSAMAQIRRSVPYYPFVVAPNGVAETHTDCWWKHGWGMQGPHAPDVVASLTGDGRNRWIGDLRRDAALRGMQTVFDKHEERWPNNGSVLFTYYAAHFWKPISPEEPPVDIVRYDRNIQGPRGRFTHWSWAATAGYCCDTLVGAVAHRPDDPRPCALMAVTAEIPYWEPDGPHPGNGRMHLCVPPERMAGETRIEGDTAVFEAAYPMACTRTIFNKPTFPTEWRCHQRWQLSRECMQGEIRIVAEKNQIARPPSLRLRFGKGLPLEKLEEDTYRCGPFTLGLDAPDFGYRTIAPAPIMLTHVKKEAAELLACSAPDLDEQQYNAGQSFTARVTITMDPPKK